MTETVLVPIDGSDSSWTALDYVLDHHDDDPVTVLHVIDPAEGNYTGEHEAGKPAERSTELLETAHERAMAEALEVDTDTATGSPAETILGYADEHGIDHIVMGSRGRSGLSRLLLGSVAETVVRRSSVPVTVAR